MTLTSTQTYQNMALSVVAGGEMESQIKELHQGDKEGISHTFTAT